MRAGLRRRPRLQVFPPLFLSFFRGCLGVVFRWRRCCLSWWHQLRGIFQREFARRLRSRLAGSRGCSNDFVVYEFVTVRMHPFALHVNPAVGGLKELAASRLLGGAGAARAVGFGGRFSPKSCSRQNKNRGDQEKSCSLHIT